MMEKYGIKEFLEEYREALEQKPEQAKPQGKPNLINYLRGKGQQGKPTWPLT